MARKAKKPNPIRPAFTMMTFALRMGAMAVGKDTRFPGPRRRYMGGTSKRKA